MIPLTGPVVVRLELPVDETLVRLARLTVSGVASVLGMGIEEAERCRAAVDELCSTLIEVGDRSATLDLTIRTDGPCMIVTGEVPRDGARRADERRRALSRLIVEAEVDAYDLSTEAPRASFRFEKRLEGVEL